jgi:hypothetical protein
MLGDIVQNIKPVFFLLFSAPAVSHSSQKWTYEKLKNPTTRLEI